MTHNATACNAAHASFCCCLCCYDHLLHVTAHISKGKKMSAIRGAESNREASLRASLHILGASGCPQGDQGAPTLHSLAPDANQTQQHKHKWGWGVGFCVCTYERQGPRDIKHQKRKIDKNKRELQTHKQNAPSIKPQPWVFDDVFYILLSGSPLWREQLHVQDEPTLNKH